MTKWGGLDVKQVPQKGRYTHEILSRYRQLEHNIKRYVNAGLPLPPMLRAQYEEFRTLGESLRRQGLLK